MAAAGNVDATLLLANLERFHVDDRTVAEDAVTGSGHKYLAARSSNFW